jgi:hypothetical protein
LTEVDEDEVIELKDIKLERIRISPVQINQNSLQRNMFGLITNSDESKSEGMKPSEDRLPNIGGNNSNTGEEYKPLTLG